MVKHEPTERESFDYVRVRHGMSPSKLGGALVRRLVRFVRFVRSCRRSCRLSAGVCVCVCVSVVPVRPLASSLRSRRSASFVRSSFVRSFRRFVGARRSLFWFVRAL